MDDDEDRIVLRLAQGDRASAGSFGVPGSRPLLYVGCIRLRGKVAWSCQHDGRSPIPGMLTHPTAADARECGQALLNHLRKIASAVNR